MKFFKQKHCKENTHLHIIWIIHYYFTVVSVTYLSIYVSLQPSIHPLLYAFQDADIKTPPPNTSACISLTKIYLFTDFNIKFEHNKMYKF